MKKYFVIFFTFLSCMSFSQSQDDSLAFVPEYRIGQNYIAKTNIGQTFTGFLIEETKQYVTLENRVTFEKTELNKNSLRSLEPVPVKKIYANIIGENPFADTYIFAGSALTFESETITANYHWFVLENINYSISENWAVTCNTLFFYPTSLGVKFAYNIGGPNYVGGNIFAFGNIAARDAGNLLLGYGAIAKYTRGTSNNNFTVSGGLLGLNSRIFFNALQFDYTNLLFANAALTNRFSERFAINAEGWYFPESDLKLAGLGIKYIHSEHTAVTLGVYTFINNRNSGINLNLKALPIPYIGYSKQF